MKFDLHTHHERCGHAEGEIEDYVLAAMDEGLDAIGISDHSPFIATKSRRFRGLRWVSGCFRPMLKTFYV